MYEYETRTYRNFIRNDLVRFKLKVRETDLLISATELLKPRAEAAVRRHRTELEEYMARNPTFERSLVPQPVEKFAPEIVQLMAEAAKVADVGPMAAVAGAIAELVGKELTRYSKEVIVENGGDIFIKSQKSRRIAIFAGKSPLSNRTCLRIDPETTPLGICTSSGTVGPSKSFGYADAVTVVCRSAALADAMATAIGNAIVTGEDIPHGLELAQRLQKAMGVVIIKDDELGLWGNINVEMI